MAEYKPVGWQDHLEDGNGNVLQEGTPLSAKNLKQMEQGIQQVDEVAGAAQRIAQETGAEVAKVKKDVATVTTQLADKASKQDIERIGNASPKGAYGTVAELNTAFPTGATGIYVVSADNKWYYWNGTAWTAGGIYQAIKLGNKTVTPEATTFIKQSTNLYDYKKTTPNKFVDTAGVVADSAINSLSDFIAISPNGNYSSKNIHTTVFYTEGKQFISRPSVVQTGATFKAPSNAFYMRMTISNSMVETAQLNEGSTLLPFESYFAEVDPAFLPQSLDGKKIDDETIPLKKLNFLQMSTNLYNYQTVLSGAFVDTSGVVQTSASNSLSDFIPITPSTIYSSSGVHTTVFYTANKTFISRPGTTGTFTTPSSAQFVRLVMSLPNVATAQLNLGDKLLPYEPYKVSISMDALPNGIVNPSINRSYYFSPEDIVSPYEAKVDAFTYYSNLDDFNNAFNSLATNHPDYLTRKTLGKDQSGAYDIYQYSAKPRQLTGADGIKKRLPKLIFVAGLHGEERNSMHNLYYLMKDICENWQTDPLLEYLRWNVEFVFIPLANPWGFANGVTRHNVNGVDLNRQFPYLWRQLTDFEYSGTAPLSEKESQYVATMLEENKDALFFGDYHTNGSTSTYEGYDKLMWFALCAKGELYDENVAITARYTIEKMTREYIKNYSLPNSVGYFGYISESNVSGGAKNYGAYLGIPSCTFETFVKLPTETIKYSPTAIQMGTELLGNWILNLIKQFKTVY